MSPEIIKGPVGRLIALSVWLILISLFLGAINGWYSQSVAACTIGSERFDRVAQSDGDADADARWARVTAAANAFTISSGAPSATVAYRLAEGTNGACQIGTTENPAGSAGPAVPATTWYTPLGTEVQSAAVAAPATDEAAGTNSNPVNIAGGEWSPAGTIFNTGGLSGLIKIILQAAGLAPPIAVMLALGGFGQSFIKNMGGNPIMAAIVTAITLLLVSTLVNTLVPFITEAFTAVDGNRFVMFSQGLGAVSLIIRQFYGVVFVAGLIIIAWAVFGAMRGNTGNALAGQRM